MDMLFTKLQSFGEHHQILIGLIIAFALVTVSWGTEKILEEYIFSLKKPWGYVLAVTIGLCLLWIIKHYIQHMV